MEKKQKIYAKSKAERGKVGRGKMEQSKKGLSRRGRSKAAGSKAEPSNTRDVPYLRCFDDGIIETERGVYTRCYEVAALHKQKEMTYSPKKTRKCMRRIFATFGEMPFQFLVRNSVVDRDEYLASVQLSHGKSDGINQCIDLYNALLSENVDVGHNNFRRSVYLVVSCEDSIYDEASDRFAELEKNLSEAFGSMYGYEARPLSIGERLGLMYEIYHPGKGRGDSEVNFMGVDKSTMKNSKGSTKDLIAPKAVKYERTNLCIGGKYARMVFINSLPSQLPESLLCDLMAVSGNSIMSVCYHSLDVEIGISAARRKVEQNTRMETIAVRDTVEDRKNKRVRTEQIPIVEDEDNYFYLSALRMFEEAEEKGEAPLMATFVMALFADSKEDLDRDTALLRMSAAKYACQIRTCDYVQKEAFQNILPLNVLKVHYARTLSLERASGVYPIDVRSRFEKRPMFQGLNQINDNFILADRRNCPIGLITGVERSGKTFSVKRDSLNVLMDSDDSIFILTGKPEEYSDFLMAVGGAYQYAHPDPFVKDPDYALGDDMAFFKHLFLEAVLSLSVSAHSNGLSSEEKERQKKHIRDEADMLAYQVFPGLLEANSYASDKGEAFPIFLSTFGGWKAEKSSYFERCNVIPCRDAVDMLVFLDSLWNYAISEKKSNRNIWIYLDGADEILYSDAASDYVLSLMDKARKLHVPITFVLDDCVHIVTHQDASIEFDYFLNHSQYFKLLSQGPIERKRFEDRLNISQSLMPYITDREPGEGILITPSLNVPFTDRFEMDSQFYKLFL